MLTIEKLYLILTANSYSLTTNLHFTFETKDFSLATN